MKKQVFECDSILISTHEILIFCKVSSTKVRDRKYEVVTVVCKTILIYGGIQYLHVLISSKNSTENMKADCVFGCDGKVAARMFVNKLF